MRDHAPSVGIVLHLDEALLWTTICFLGAIDARGEAF